jgi:hypothetical protein
VELGHHTSSVHVIGQGPLPWLHVRSFITASTRRLRAAGYIIETA